MASRLQDVILRGTRAAQPLATAVAPGTLYYVTDESVTERSDGTNWETYTDGGGAGGGLSAGMSTIGNTVGTTGLASQRLILAGGANITLSGSTNAGSMTITISGGAGGGGGTGSISAGTTRATLGEVVFSNSNGVSFGVNGQTVTATIATSLTNIRVSAGTTSNLLSAITFNNANNVSFGLNASVITASVTVASTQGSVNLSAGTTSNLASAFTFSNSNGVSFGLDASTITASIATSLTNIRVSAGTTSNLLSAITFSNSNGISFGLDASTLTASYIPFSGGNTNVGNNLGDTGVVTGRLVLVGSQNITLSGSTNGGSMTISFSGGAGAAGNTGSISAGTTRATLGEVVFSNSNGISFGVDGQTVTASHNGLTSQSNQAASADNGSFAFQTISFSNANNVSFITSAGSAIAASVATSLTNIRVSAGTTSNLLSAITFSNSNGISFGIDASTITASHNGITTQTNQTLGLYAVGNTTGQSTSSTFDARTISFVGQGIASVGFSNGSVNISVPSGGGAGDGGVFAGVSTAGNTAGSTGTVSTGNFVLVGTNGVSLSQSTGAAGSAATVTINAPAVPNLSIWQNELGGTVTQAALNLSSANSAVIFPFLNIFPGNMTPGTFYIKLTGNITATASSSSNTISFDLGFYTWNNSSLSLVFSAQSTLAVAAATSNTALTNGIRFLSFHSSLFNITPVFSQTNYWAAVMVRTSNLMGPMSFIGNILAPQGQISGTFGTTVATATSQQHRPFFGHYSATSAALPGSIGLNQVNASTLGSAFPTLLFANIPFA